MLRTRTLPNIPPPYKELLYLLRNSPPVVTRDPETFLDVARSVLRVDLNILSKRSKSIILVWGYFLRIIELCKELKYFVRYFEYLK